MKKSTKIISLILSMVLAFSFIPTIASAGVITDTKATTVEQLIQNENLAKIVDWLLKNLSGSKANITGTVLRLAFTFVKDEGLQAIIGDKDPVKLSDAENAKILLDYLDKNLPEWTKDITSQSWYGTVSKLVTLDLKSVNGVLNTVYGLGTSGAVHMLGDLKGLTADSLKVSYKSGLLTKNRAIQRGDGDVKVIYALLDWVDEVSPLVEKFVKGGIGSSGLSIGSLANSLLGDNLDDINAMVKNIPAFAKGYIYLLIDGKAEKPDLKKNPDGALNESGYKGYTADQLLAAALIRLIEEKEPSDVITKADCDAALNMSVYGLLANYGPELYNRFAINALNTTVKENIKGVIADYKDAGLDKILNADYNFDETFFDDALKANLKEYGVLGSFNNILVKVASVMLTADTYKALDLKTGKNAEALNDNLTKILKVALPIFNTDSIEEKLGFKFDEFTAETVKDMKLEDMAVATLKIFYPTWFGDACKAEDLAKTDSLEKVAVLAVYYAYTKYAKVEGLTLDLDKITDADACYETILNWSGKIAADGIASSESTRYSVPADAKTYDDYFNSIVDWALNFVKGVPAAAVAKNLYTSDKGYFYKLNVVLNAMIDLNFINGMNDGFVVDLEKLVFDGVLGNILDFDVASFLGLVEKNNDAKNPLNKTTITGVLQIVDKALTSLFKMEADPETAAPAAVVVPDVKKGDVDGDGEVKVPDARLALRQAVKLENYAADSREYKACDVNGDGTVAVTDARLILRVAVKLDTEAVFA